MISPRLATALACAAALTALAGCEQKVPEPQPELGRVTPPAPGERCSGAQAKRGWAWPILAMVKGTAHARKIPAALRTGPRK